MALPSEQDEINFLGGAAIAGDLSGVSAGVYRSLATRGLNFGIDFTGGILLEVGMTARRICRYAQPLTAGGFGDAQVQNFGTAPMC